MESHKSKIEGQSLRILLRRTKKYANRLFRMLEDVANIILECINFPFSTDKAIVNYELLLLPYIDLATNEEFPEKVRFGIEASYVDGSPAPLGILADSVTVDAQTGEIKLTGFKGDKLSPQRDSLRVRVIAERIDTEPEKPVLERFASKYIPVALLGDGSIITGRLTF